MPKDNQIISSLNKTFLFKRLESYNSKFVVVAADGSGNFTTIQSAIASGANHIFVKSGTYYVDSADLDITGVHLIGENAKSTIITLQNDYSIHMREYAAATRYNDGTFTLTNGSDDVTGAGTSWASGANNPDSFDNPYFRVNGICSPVNSFTNDTSFEINLGIDYQGPTSAGLSYDILDLGDIGRIENFTIIDESIIVGHSLLISGLKPVVTDCVFYNNSILRTAIDCQYSSSAFIHNNIFEGYANGIAVSYSDHTLISVNNFYYSSAYSITVNESSYNTISDNLFAGIEGGIYFDSNMDYTSLVNNYFLLCNSYCVYFENIQSHFIAQGNFLSSNSNSVFYADKGTSHIWSGNVFGTTSDIDFYCDDSNIINNIFNEELVVTMSGARMRCSSNFFVLGNIHSTGSNNIVSFNIFEDAAATYAIRCRIGTFQICSSNIILDCTSGIFIDANSCECTSNFVYSASSDGIVLDGSDITCISNYIHTCTSEGIICEANVDSLFINSNFIYEANAASIFVECNGDLVISNNFIYSSSGTSTGIYVPGSVYRALEISIHDNYIKKSYNAINVSADSNYLSIQSNLIIDPSGDGIQVTDGTYAIISNNIILESTGYGIRTKCVGIISSNIIKTTTSHGISMENSGSCCNNYIAYSGSHSIRITSSASCSTISSNYCKQPGGAGHCIYCEAYSCSITSNSCLDSANDAIRCTNLRCAVSSNVIYDPSDHGIYFSNAADYSTCIGNTIYSAGDDSIYSAGDYCSITGNVIQSGAADGISIADDFNVCSANIVTACTGTGIITAATADRSNVIGNISLSNTAAQYTDNGTNTNAANNIIA